MKHFLQDSWLLDDMMFVFLSLHHPQSPHLPLAIPFQIVFFSLLLLAGRKVEEGGAEEGRRGEWKNGRRGREEREVEKGRSKD